MDKAKKLYELVDLEAKKLHNGVEELAVNEGEPIARLSAYISLQKGKAKVPKDPDSGKFTICMSLLPE